MKCPTNFCGGMKFSFALAFGFFLLTLPATAVVRDGDKALAWKVAGEKLQRVTLSLAERDTRTGNYVVKGGLAEGDQVIKYPNTMLKEGQSVQAATAPKSSMAEAAK